MKIHFLSLSFLFIFSLDVAWAKLDSKMTARVDKVLKASAPKDLLNLCESEKSAYNKVSEEPPVVTSGSTNALTSCLDYVYKKTESNIKLDSTSVCRLIIQKNNLKISGSNLTQTEGYEKKLASCKSQVENVRSEEKQNQEEALSLCREQLTISIDLANQAKKACTEAGTPNCLSTLIGCMKSESQVVKENSQTSPYCNLSKINFYFDKDKQKDLEIAKERKSELEEKNKRELERLDQYQQTISDKNLELAEFEAQKNENLNSFRAALNEMQDANTDLISQERKAMSSLEDQLSDAQSQLEDTLLAIGLKVQEATQNCKTQSRSICGPRYSQKLKDTSTNNAKISGNAFLQRTGISLTADYHRCLYTQYKICTKKQDKQGQRTDYGDALYALKLQENAARKKLQRTKLKYLKEVANQQKDFGEARSRNNTKIVDMNQNFNAIQNSLENQRRRVAGELSYAIAQQTELLKLRQYSTIPILLKAAATIFSKEKSLAETKTSISEKAYVSLVKARGLLEDSLEASNAAVLDSNCPCTPKEDKRGSGRNSFLKLQALFKALSDVACSTTSPKTTEFLMSPKNATSTFGNSTNQSAQ